MTPATTPRSAAIEAEAAAWIVRLHSQRRSTQLETGLRRWLDENAENARVFESMTQAWDDATSLAAQEPFPRIRGANRSARHNGRFLPIAAAIVILCGAAAFLFSTWPQNTYTTDIGEQLTLRLKDGTRITLNSGSELETAYTDTARHIQLRAGEALFEVAKDPNRPFTVNAADRTITALGTSFLIRTQSKKTAITLIEGKVAVSSSASLPPTGQTTKPPAEELTPEVILRPGQRLTISSSRKAPTGEAKSGEPAAIDTPRIDTLTAWRRNEAIFEKTTLTDAISEMNRYDEIQLAIDTPGIDNLEISGIYRTGDNSGFAQTIANIYQLKITQTRNRIQIAAQ